MDTVYKPIFDGSEKQYPVSPPKIDLIRLCMFYGTRQLVCRSATTADESKVLYTVPAGKVLLLLTATISSASNDTSRRTGWVCVSPSNQAFDNINDSMILVTATPVPSGTANNAISPSIPIILQAGERVGLFNKDTDCTTTGGFSGYEIDTNLFQTLL